MNNDDSLAFVRGRLRRRHASALHRDLRLRPPGRVTRRVALELARGSNQVFDPVDDSVVVCCASGSLWITQDGDPKDSIVGAQESYRAERDRPMHVYALQPCVIEIEFEDEAQT
jgi:hypothetical protein